MKKFTIWLLVLAMVLCVLGCASREKVQQALGQQVVDVNEHVRPEPEPEPEPVYPEEKLALVVGLWRTHNSTLRFFPAADGIVEVEIKDDGTCVIDGQTFEWEFSSEEEGVCDISVYGAGIERYRFGFVDNNQRFEIDVVLKDGSVEDYLPSYRQNWE